MYVCDISSGLQCVDDLHMYGGKTVDTKESQHITDGSRRKCVEKSGMGVLMWHNLQQGYRL